MPCTVYFLRDPRNNAIRYVGISTNPQMRFERHLRGVSGPWCRRWVRSLVKEGTKPILEIHYVAPSRDHAALTEMLLIRMLPTLGVRLTNLSPGGE